MLKTKQLAADVAQAERAMGRWDNEGGALGLGPKVFQAPARPKVEDPEQSKSSISAAF